MFVSPALQRGVTGNQIDSSPVGTTPVQLPKHVTLVVFDATVTQESDKFLFKVALAVMLLLILNVPPPFPH